MITRFTSLPSSPFLFLANQSKSNIQMGDRGDRKRQKQIKLDKPPSSLSKRPDNGGKHEKRIELLVNHFLLGFNNVSPIYEYDIAILEANFPVMDKGFHQSLKHTEQGYVLILDCSVSPFSKSMPVIDFLEERFPQFKASNYDTEVKESVEKVLLGLKVKVNYRRTKRNFSIAGLSTNVAGKTYIFVDDERTDLVTYFKNKWDKEVKYKHIHCLDLGKNKRMDKVPMEFCELVGLQKPSKPEDRMDLISQMVKDGLNRDVARNFGIQVDEKMTNVDASVMEAPKLKLGHLESGHFESVEVDDTTRQWNLAGKSFLDGKDLKHWAFIDFTESADDQWLKDREGFVEKLMVCGKKLGIEIGKPCVSSSFRISNLSSMDGLENLLQEEVVMKSDIEKLQMILCVMTKKNDGYKLFKWLTETKIGVITQCCLSEHAIKAKGYYMNHLCLKINAKLGGSNFELRGKLLNYDGDEHVMFIGAAVNHPPPKNKSSPSIAAVVGSVNWPAVNRYVARIEPQSQGTETIKKFGAMCRELVLTYERLNKVKPAKIVVFRNGASEGEFEKILAEELADLKRSIYGNKYYEPKITVIVAQKQHHTRLFLEKGEFGSVPPGTVVDRKIVHPNDFDFYLCSHYGGLGMSKPTHYYVLSDANSFSSKKLQKLIYHMCFTFVRCTKPVSLVPPAYYACEVAYRGRIYENAAAKQKYPNGWFTVPGHLKDTMFFI